MGGEAAGVDGSKAGGRIVVGGPSRVAASAGGALLPRRVDGSAVAAKARGGG
jgi:hypothetical protein